MLPFLGLIMNKANQLAVKLQNRISRKLFRVKQLLFPIWFAWNPGRRLFFSLYDSASFKAKESLLRDYIQISGVKWIPRDFNFLISIAGKKLTVPIRSNHFAGDMGLALCVLGLDAPIKNLYALIFRSPDISRRVLIVDVGANYGQNLLIFCCHSMKVVAFEPNPQCWPELDRVLDVNAFSPRMIKAALGSTPGETLLKWPHGQTWLSSLSDPNSKHLDDCNAFSSCVVPVVTLDSQVKAAKDIVLIKIDVEGFESSVLNGGRNLLLSNDCLVIFEHDIDRVQGRRELWEFFSGIGYSIFRPCLDASLPLDCFMSIEQYLSDPNPNHVAMRATSEFSFLAKY